MIFNTTNVMGIILLILTVTGCAVVLICTWNYAFGAERVEYVGTSDWLTKVDKCVDLYQETEKNETLYYKCMNGIEGVNTE